MPGKTPYPENSPPRHLLVRGVNWVGDSVMTTPALQQLRERFPQSRISILVPEKLADLWQHHPSIDAVLTFAVGESPWVVARRLRREAVDVALVLPNSPRSALEVWLAGIPTRVGLSRPWRNWFLTGAVPPRPDRALMRKRTVREIKRLVRSPGLPAGSTSGNRAASSSALPASPNAHQIHDYLHLAAALGAEPKPLAPRLEVLAHEFEGARKKFGLPSASSGKAPMLALNAGAEYGPAKRWPAERFIAAVRDLRRRLNCAVVVLGAQGDVPLAASIESALRTEPSSHAPEPPLLVNLAGRTSLRELMVVLKSCRLLLTNDSGPMHVAAALGTPVVVPFGSTSPPLTGPGLPGAGPHRLLQVQVPCSPCFRRICPVDFRCMTGLSVASVVDAALQAWG